MKGGSLLKKLGFDLKGCGVKCYSKLCLWVSSSDAMPWSSTKVNTDLLVLRWAYRNDSAMSHPSLPSAALSCVWRNDWPCQLDLDRLFLLPQWVSDSNTSQVGQCTMRKQWVYMMRGKISKRGYSKQQFEIPFSKFISPNFLKLLGSVTDLACVQYKILESVLEWVKTFLIAKALGMELGRKLSLLRSW